MEHRAPIPFERIEEERDRSCTVTLRQETVQKILTVSQILNFVCTLIDQKMVKTIMRIYDAKHKDDIVFEIKFFNYDNKARFLAQAFDHHVMQINGIKIREIENRSVIKQIQRELISVVVYEVPDEIEDEEIMVVLRKYGEIRGEMYRHLHKGFSVENGNRSVLYERQPANIPTILWVGGNKIKCRYEGQDRTPICSYCKTKGHYRAICEKEAEDKAFYRRMEEEQEAEDIRRLQEREAAKGAEVMKKAGQAWTKEAERKKQEVNESATEESDNADMGDGDGDDNLTVEEESDIEVDESDGSLQCGQNVKRTYSKMAGEQVDEEVKKKKDKKSAEERERRRKEEKEKKQRKETEELQKATLTQMGMRQPGQKQRSLKQLKDLEDENSIPK